ncbi:RNA-dependent RNA polymerase [Bactrocera dorsalis borna-like virus]|nr:RNA-dependent RNA polymerase [Bactrocera dorsalis borna-like virus]
MSDAEEDLRVVDSSQSYISKLYKKLKFEQEQAILDQPKNVSIKTKFNINTKNLLHCSAKEPNAPAIPGHLASPITADDQIFLLTHDRFYCRRHRFFKNIITENNINFHLNGPGHRCKIYPCVTHLVSSNFSKEVNAKSHLLEKQFDKIYDLALLTFHIKKFDFLSPLKHIISYEASVVHNTKMFSLQPGEKKLLLSLFQDKIIAEYYKDKICNKRIPFSKLLYVNEDLLLEKDTSLLYCEIHKTKLLAPTSQVIMVLDTLQARFPLVLYWTLSDKVGKYPGYSIRNIGLKIIQYFEYLRDNVLGSEFYSFISKWEALVLGYVISDPLDLGNTSLYCNIKQDMEELLNQTLPPFLLPSSFYLNEIKLYLELTGITKIFGHPCIDMEKSLDVVKTHGGSSSQIETIDITNVVATIIEHFVKNYRNKHGYYPKIRHAPSRLRRFFKTQEIIQRSHRIDATDWLALVFDKNFDFDYSFDTSVFIKDTALAVPMSQWS